MCAYAMHTSSQTLSDTLVRLSYTLHFVDLLHVMNVHSMLAFNSLHILKST